MRLIAAAADQCGFAPIFAMRVQTAVVLLVLVAVARADEKPAKIADNLATPESKEGKSKRGLFDIGLGYDFGGHELLGGTAALTGGLELGSLGLGAIGHDEGKISGITIHREVKVPIPAPYKVEKHVPVPYPVHVKVPVDRPVPYHVPSPYPVPVEKHVPYPVEKLVPYPVKVPVKVAVEEPYPVHVPVKVPYPVEKPVPYPVKVPVVVKESYPVYIKESHHDLGEYQHLSHGYH